MAGEVGVRPPTSPDFHECEVGEDKNVKVFIQDPADYRACLNGITHTSGFNLIVFQKYILHL